MLGSLGGQHRADRCPSGPVRTRLLGGVRLYLLVDALQVHEPGVPELKFHTGQWVQAIQQGLSGVFAQHIPDLMRPINDDGLNGVQERVVQGGGEPVEGKVGMMLSWPHTRGFPCH